MYNNITILFLYIYLRLNNLNIFSKTPLRSLLESFWDMYFGFSWNHKCTENVLWPNSVSFHTGRQQDCWDSRQHVRLQSQSVSSRELVRWRGRVEDLSLSWRKNGHWNEEFHSDVPGRPSWPCLLSRDMTRERPVVPVTKSYSAPSLHVSILPLPPVYIGAALSVNNVACIDSYVKPQYIWVSSSAK